MNLDFYLNNTSRFNARSSALIYNKDKSKILIFNMERKNRYMLPGGRIEFNETSKDAIKREVKEETNYDLDFKLISIQETFATINDIEIMQYAFYYEAIYEGKIENSFKCFDNDSQMFYWINIKDIDNYNIFPPSVKNLLNHPNEITHIIEKY